MTGPAVKVDVTNPETVLATLLAHTTVVAVDGTALGGLVGARRFGSVN